MTEVEVNDDGKWCHMTTEAKCFETERQKSLQQTLLFDLGLKSQLFTLATKTQPQDKQGDKFRML